LGLIFGSFGSVIFFRLGDVPSWKTLQGFFIGRSECRYCHHTLHTQDLIPLRSFFSQGGKCRYCQKKLSWWYPTLELGTVAIFVGVYLAVWNQWQLPNANELCLHWGILLPVCRNAVSFFSIALGLWLLFIIALYDLKEYELHLTASILLLLLSFLGQWALGYNLWDALEGMLIFFGVFLLIYVIARGYVYVRYQKKAEGFGFGDVVLAGILGSILPVFVHLTGTLEWIYLLSTYVIVSCVLGIVSYGVLYWWTAKKMMAIPFLPAMIVAFVLFTMYGERIISFLVHF
jgi:prepilin signal peptidase PulO-like enzyme (type II secretory pathway)